MHKIGIEVSDYTVRRYRRPRLGPLSQSRRPFLKNHVRDIIVLDFFFVLMVTFRMPYVPLIMSHDHRRTLHFNVATSPSARWTIHKIVEAFLYEAAAPFLGRMNATASCLTASRSVS